MKISSALTVLLVTAVVLAHAASTPALRDGAQDQSRPAVIRQLGNDEEDTTYTSQLLSWLFTLFYSNPAGENDEDEADYIVEFDDDLEDVQLIANEIAESLGKQPAHVYTQLIHGFTISGITQEMAASIAAVPEVMSVVKDEEVSMDGELRHLIQNSNMPQEVPWGIERVDGGKATYTGDNVVFVVDSGMDLDHPDLNIHPTLRFSAFDDDSNDENGHGTHVSGVIGALDNDIGVVGVAPGAPIVPVKVLNSEGKGNMANVIRAIEWIASVGKRDDVVNLSLSGNANDALDKVIVNAAKKGIKFTLSAGNEATLASTRSPSRTNHRRVKTICASDEKDNMVWFSNRGKPPVDYCAPGKGILSTFKDGAYAVMQGTSMASPHAAGVLFLGRVKRKYTMVTDVDGNKYKIVAVR